MIILPRTNVKEAIVYSQSNV